MVDRFSSSPRGERPLRQWATAKERLQPTPSSSRRHMRPQATWSFSWPFKETSPQNSKGRPRIYWPRATSSSPVCSVRTHMTTSLSSSAATPRSPTEFAPSLATCSCRCAKTARHSASASMESEHLTRARCLSSPPGSVGQERCPNGTLWGLRHHHRDLKAPHAWSWPQSLRYRVYGVELEARLSLAPAREEAAGNAERKSRADGRGVGTIWQVVRTKPRVAKAEPCRDFARGACTRGDKCIFRHSKEACRDAARGRCTRQNCMFEHLTPALADADVKSRPSAPRSAAHADANPNEGRGMAEDRKAGSEPVITRCLDFERGRCRRNLCKFAHGAASPSPRPETGNSSTSASSSTSTSSTNSTSTSCNSGSSSCSSKNGNHCETHASGTQAGVMSSSPNTSSQNSTPRRRRREGSNEDEGGSDVEEEDELTGDLAMRDSTPPGSPMRAQQRGRSRSDPGSPTRAQQRAQPRSPCPLPESPRGAWAKGGPSPRQQPAPKRRKAHSSKPPSPATAAATAAQPPASPNGADSQVL